ncbi:MAG: [Fe-Fe] hydrogenase large subunit C-terminal domain-containing protein [Bacillota bacterium]|nr:[Fe-Fe] hydrogenase large subunit C-terminal domain-containing protein [Bacillota bacterium]
MRNVIDTIISNCQDCYRCVRACPVKAIKITGAQARIVNDLCISCGTCVRECPKHAKVSVSQIESIRELLQGPDPVVASVAPSFAALFSGWQQTRLPAALRMLGFAHVSETAEGAELVSQRSLEKREGTSICTACPAVVNYIEQYHPEYLDMLIPVVSPMIMHGKILKQRYPGCKVVFIGPCAAKKQEAERPEYEGIIDAVMTFQELKNWLDSEGVNLSTCPESGFESYGDLSRARLFPLQGGMLKTCDIACDNTEARILHVGGPNEVKALFSIPPEEWGYDIVEPLFCTEGCINGPCFSLDGEDESIYTLRNGVIGYAAETLNLPNREDYSQLDSGTSFYARPAEKDEVSEEDIQKVFEKTGKSNPEMQLNCGACGYNSCREKAIAVVRGLAEPEMCMPYMRRNAQQRTDKIIEMSPTGIVIVDEDLNMIHMNAAFQKMFMCNNDVLGRRISYLIDSEGFEKLAVGLLETYESIKAKYGKKYHEVLYTVAENKQYVGIYTDMSQMKMDSSQLDLVKRQTLQQAKELLNHQIEFSQEMAHYLGKSTARNEELVKQLIDLYEESKY